MSIGKKFIELTKYSHLDESDQALGKPSPPLEEPYTEDGKVIDLPDAKGFKPADIDLTEAIIKRKSVREYSQKPISLEELSYLLWITQGVRKTWRDHITLRNVPSAGARHAFETYLLINNVEGLEPGLYRYLALKHKLAEIDMDSNIADEISSACFGQTFVKNGAVTFLWVAVSYRMNWRYGERGYRYLFLDAGHVCQNLYVGAEAIDAGVCAVGAYDDEKINELLGLDTEEQFCIYIAACGKRKTD